MTARIITVAWQNSTSFDRLWWLGGLVARSLDLRLDSCDLRVSFPATAAIARMSDCLWMDKPLWYFTKPSRPTQHPILYGTGTEYWLKCGDALWLGNKGRMTHSLVDKCVGRRQNCVILVNTCQSECFKDEYRTRYKVLCKCPVYFTLLSTEKTTFFLAYNFLLTPC